MTVDASAPPDSTTLSGEDAEPTLPWQIRNHLGSLLADAYGREEAYLNSTVRFADLLAKLDAASGQARDRNDIEFRRLLLDTTSALRRFANSLTRDPTTADDLVQETMLRAWKNRARFEPGTNFEAWTFTILRNQFYTDRRKHREVQDEEGVHASRLVSLPEQAGHLDLQDVRAAFARLTPAMRETLILVTVQGLSYEDAASVMGCQVGTVKSRVWRARDELVHLLGYTGGEVGHDAVMLSTQVTLSKGNT